MATKNRGVLVATADVLIDALEMEFDQVSRPVTEELGLVDRIGERQAQALDMTWMRRYHMWREWIGEREMRHDRRLFQARMYARKFEDTIRVPIEDIEDGVEANFDPQGEAAMLRQGYEDLVEKEHNAYFTHAFDQNFIKGSVTGPYGEEIYVGSMDGEPLLSDSHPYYEQIEYNEAAPQGERVNLVQGGTYSNLVNDALTIDNLWKAVRNYREMKDYRGRPANAGMPDTLVVGPKLEQQAREILEQTNVLVSDSNGAAAINKARPNLDVRVNNWLYGTADGCDFNFDGTPYSNNDVSVDDMWFLVNTSSNRSPFVHWDRKLPEIQRPVGTPGLEDGSPAEGAVDYLTFKDDSVQIGARARFGVSFGVPHTIYASFGGVSL